MAKGRLLGPLSSQSEAASIAAALSAWLIIRGWSIPSSLALP
jgi:hypothetical protein